MLVGKRAFFVPEKKCRRYVLPALPMEIRQNLIWSAVVVTALCLHLIAYLDKPIALYIRTLNPAITHFFKGVTVFGDSLYYLVPSFIFFWVFRLGYKKSREGLWRERFRRYSHSWLFLFVSIGASGLVNDLLKILFGRPRPKLMLSGGQDSFSFFQLSSSLWSFPSGHANTAFALMTALWVLAPRGRWLYLPLAVLVASSRVMVSKHYPSDVLAGAFLAVVVTLYVRQIFLKRGISLSL